MKGYGMNGLSFYQERLKDEKAVYFTEEYYDIKRDGTVDVSEQLQKAIYSVVEQRGVTVFFLCRKENTYSAGQSICQRQ